MKKNKIRIQNEVEKMPTIVIEAEVARRIRQHSRSSMKAEVCGVLIGAEEGQTTLVQACIAGVNAAQGGAHVTFTQETWEHIYQIKDKEYPDHRIVGWYHSHPGFGVFLSEHDTFIQQNFFSSPRQIAWVYDPHSDEEGCFGWYREKITKLEDIHYRFLAPAGGIGETSDAKNNDGPENDEGPKHGGTKHGGTKDEGSRQEARRRENPGKQPWTALLVTASMYFLVFALGCIATFWFITRQAYLVSPKEMEKLSQEVQQIEQLKSELEKKQAEQQGNANDGLNSAPSASPKRPAGGKKNGSQR